MAQGPRVSSAGKELVSVAKKMEAMMDVATRSADETLIVLHGIQTVITDSIVVELKLQTVLLTKISEGMSASVAGDAKARGDKFDAETFDAMSNSVTMLNKAAKKIKPKYAKNLKILLSAVSEGFGDLAKDEKAAENMNATGELLKNISESIVSFGLGLMIYTKLAPKAMKGAEMFGKTINILLKSANLATSETKAIEGGTETKGGDSESAGAIGVIAGIGKSVLLFGIGMSLYTLMAPTAMIGALLFGLTIRLLVKAAGEVKKETAEGMESLLKLSKDILIFGLAMSAFVILGIPALIGSLLFLGVTFLLAKGLTLLGSEEAQAGAKSLLITSLAIVGLGLSLLVFSMLVNPLQAVLTALVIGLIGFTFYMIGEEAEKIALGALSMIVVGISLYIITASLVNFAESDFGAGDGLILGGVLLGLSVIYNTMGKSISQIFMGALSVAVIGLSLYIVTAGLLQFGEADLTAEDGLILAGILTTLGVGFAAAGVASILIIPGAIAMASVGVALISISGALQIWKTVNWESTDSDNLQEALGAVVNGFLGGEIPGGLIAGIKYAAKAAARAALLYVTVPPMILAGVALISISKGLSLFKKAQFTSDDGIILESTIGSLMKAFSLPGDIERQKKLGINIDPAQMAAGIQSLTGIGNIISSLAGGIQDFASMTITEYEVVNAGTSRAKLVPKLKRKLKDSEIVTAGENIGKILDVMGSAIAKIGEDEEKGYGIFSGGRISKGTAAIAGLGDNVSSIASAVLSYAKLEIPQFTLINAGTSKAKLVPGTPIQLSKTDLDVAASNLGSVLKIVGESVAEIGAGEGFWAGTVNISEGKRILAGLGTSIKAIADSVLGFAKAEFQPMELIDGELVASGSPIKLGKTELDQAATNIGSMLNIVGKSVGDFGIYAWENYKYLDYGKKQLGEISETLTKSAGSISKFAAIKDFEGSTAKISTFLDSLKLIFDPATNPNIGQSTNYFNAFAWNLEKMANSVDKFSGIADNFDRMQKSLGLMKNHINEMDLQKLTLTDNMLNSLAVLSKDPDSLAKNISGSIEKAYEQLAIELKKMIESLGESSTAGSSGIIDSIKKFGNSLQGTPIPEVNENGGDVPETPPVAATLPEGPMRVKIINWNEIGPYLPKP